MVGYVLRMYPQASETFVANEILELERLGLPIHVYSYRRPSAPVPHDCVRNVRAPVTYLPDPVWRHPLAFLRAHRALYRRDAGRYRGTLRYAAGYFVRTRNLDVWRRFVQAGYMASALDPAIERLHAHFAHASTHVALLVAKFAGLPFSFSAHARDLYTADVPLLREKVAQAERVMTCTEANRTHLRQLLDEGQRGKIEAVYHGVDLDKFTPGEEPPSGAVPAVLAVGRLVEKKGLDLLVRACALLRERGVRFMCRIAGEGPERARLETLVREHQLDGLVELPGACSQEELVGEYRRAALLALPCVVLENGDRDGIPNVLVEAMATGLPVVSTAVSGIPELVETGENGLLVPERDAAALAGALELLLGDPALRERLGRSARATVEQRFDVKAAARTLAARFAADGRSPATANAPAEAVR